MSTTEEKTHQTMTLRLAASNWKLLEALSSHMGVPKTSVIALALQEMAARKGVDEAAKKETATL